MFGQSLTHPRVLLVVTGFATLVLLSACGGEDDAAAALDDVASLQANVLDGDSAAADAATIQTDQPELSPDEAALEFSQCMRDGGVDFPDLSIDAEGNIELRAAFQDIDRDQEGFRDIADGCRGLLESAGFGGGRRQLAESTEVQDALLEFSDCVRDDGFDVGDLTLEGRGRGAGDGDAQQAQEQEGQEQQAQGQGQQGQRQQGFGNRNARFAESLGLDYEDSAVQETIDSCAVVIEEAFAAAGVGQPRTEG